MGLVIRILILLGLLAPALAWPQGRIFYRQFVEKYDLDSTTETYCVTGDSSIVGAQTVSTVGSSTTVTADASTPFDPVDVGDVMTFALTSTSGAVVRYVTAKASGSSITVDTAVTLSAVRFSFREVACGTAATSGWMDVSNYSTKAITFQLDQVNATGGIKMRYECRTAGAEAQPIRVYPGETSDCGGGTLTSNFCVFTTAGIDSRLTLVLDEPWKDCRVAMAIVTADDGGDTGANAEQISIYFVGNRLQAP